MFHSLKTFHSARRLLSPCLPTLATPPLAAEVPARSSGTSGSGSGDRMDRMSYSRTLYRKFDELAQHCQSLGMMVEGTGFVGHYKPIQKCNLLESLAQEYVLALVLATTCFGICCHLSLQLKLST